MCFFTTKNYKDDNLNHKGIAENKQFWRTAKPLHTEKSKSIEKITLVEDNKIISEDKDNAELLNSFSNSQILNAVKMSKFPNLVILMP